MADEELRQLEREALANPTDRAAAWRHARALERSGDRRGYLVATSRLARLGDEDARAVLRDVVALQPVGPRRSQARRCAPLREPWRVRTAHLPVVGPAHVVASTEGALFVRNHEELVAIDTQRLVERWRRPVRNFAGSALRGEDVVVGDDRDLVLLDGATGRELARERQRGLVAQLVSDADRAAALVGANDQRLWLLVGLDVGPAFGMELWRRVHREVDQGGRTLLGIVGDVVLLRTPPAGLKVDDGTPDPAGTEHARRLDYHEPLGPHGELPREADARLSASFGGWGVAVAWDSSSSSSRDHSALDLTSPGRERRIQLPPLPTESSASSRHAREVASVALGGDLGYVVSARRRRDATAPDSVTVQALDLETGRVRVNVSLAVYLAGEAHTIEAIALDGALLVVVTTPTTCTLIRFEAAPTS